MGWLSLSAELFSSLESGDWYLLDQPTGDHYFTTGFPLKTKSIVAGHVPCIDNATLIPALVTIPAWLHGHQIQRRQFSRHLWLHVYCAISGTTYCLRYLVFPKMHGLLVHRRTFFQSYIFNNICTINESLSRIKHICICYTNRRTLLTKLGQLFW